MSTQYSDTVRVLALQRHGGVTPRLFEALWRRFRGLDQILSRERADFLTIDGVTEQMAVRLASVTGHLADAHRLAQTWAARDITMLSRFDDAYPLLLSELNDPPPLLFIRGNAPDGLRRSVALVGATDASAEGIEMTSRLTREFVAADVQIMSSLIGRIDAAAHLAGIAAGGRVFAISDCGFDHLPTGDGMPLAIDVARHGGVISEYCPDIPAHDSSVRQANRLLAGLAQAVVVTEIRKDSERVLDLLSFCCDIGKMAFVMVDPDKPALTDPSSLRRAVECGALPMVGDDKVTDIIRVLV